MLTFAVQLRKSNAPERFPEHSKQQNKMKAIIKQTLVEPTRKGNTTTIETIIGAKSCIVSKVQNYIFQRTNKEGFIKVAKFEVNIYDHHNKSVNQWQYTPTYR